MRFTIKSVEPGGMCPDDLKKVIQDCHLDAKYLVAQMDKQTLGISEGDAIECVENDPDLTKILREKIISPLVIIDLPQIAMTFKTEWKLSKSERDDLYKYDLK